MDRTPSWMEPLNFTWQDEMGNIVYPLSLIYSAALISSQGISETLIPENKSFLSGTWLCLSYLTLSHGFLFPRSVILKSMFPRPAALVSLETYKKFKFTVLIPGLLNQKPLVWGLAISVLTSPPRWSGCTKFENHCPRKRCSLSKIRRPSKTLLAYSCLCVNHRASSGRMSLQACAC